MKYIKFILFFLIIGISFIYTYNYLETIKIYSSNEQFIMSLLNNSNHYFKCNRNKFLYRVTGFISNVNMKDPITILEKNFHYKNNQNSELVYNDNYNPDELNSEPIKDSNPTKTKEPLVYIYNSHQLENYSSVNYEAYNITPNVMMASYLFREKLNDLGINTIVEEADITEFIRINNWNYNYSYVASRYYIEDAISKNPSLNFFID